MALINTDGCVLHPKRVSHIPYSTASINNQRRIRHMRGISLYNISPSVRSQDFSDVFYSLHYSTGEPFYVSEVRHDCVDTEFQEFQLVGLRGNDQQDLVVKVWIWHQGWTLLIRAEFNLTSLLYCNQPHGNNCVMMDLMDGKYLIPTNGIDLDSYRSMIHHNEGTRVLKSLTYDTLVKLNGLELSLEDIARSKTKISKQIHVDTTLSWQPPIGQLLQSIAKERTMRDIKREKLESLKQLQREKQKHLRQRSQKEEKRLEEFQTYRQDHLQILVKYEATVQDLTVERSKVIQLVKSIFQIDTIAEWLLIPQFDLLPLSIPLNEIDMMKQEEFNAGLGSLVLMTIALSNYLAVPMRFKLKFFGSYSMVVDNISQIQQRRVFPLFYTQHYHRLQYGVHLLVANINDIMAEKHH